MTTCSRLFHSVVFAGAIAIVVIAAAVIQPHSQEVASSVEVAGTTLRVRLPDGSVRAGAELIGGVLTATFGGQSLRVRIDGVEQDPRDPQGEVLLYDFRAVAPDGRTEPLCTPDPDGRRRGLALAGRSEPWGFLTIGEPGVFELVCTAGPQAKCVRMGYAPWRKAPDGRPMIDWFNACVRMLRGDYCGDGRPFTRDGTWIDLYDRIGIQKSDNDPSLSFEAAWGPNGATCVARTRLPDLIDLDDLARVCPRLSGRLGPAACSEDDRDGLVMNRSRQQ